MSFGRGLLGGGGGRERCAKAPCSIRSTSFVRARSRAHLGAPRVLAIVRCALSRLRLLAAMLAACGCF